MIPMAVRQDHGFHGAEIDAQTCAVVLDCKLDGAGIEQHRVLGSVAAGGDHEREPVVGAALARACQFLHARSHQSRPFERHIFWAGG
jgi:hypothetical protein